MALLSTVYTTEARMQRLIGADAITSHADHDQDGVSDSEVVNDMINRATETISYYGQQRYSSSGLASSELIAQWATTLACYYLMQTRGNPAPESLKDEYDFIMERLSALASGRESLPGVALGQDFRPSMSNRKIDRRHKVRTVRKTRSNSTDAPTKLSEHRSSSTAYDL